MRDLLDQIYSAVNAGHYYLCLFPSLTLPDICAAMESENGWATQAKYIAWFDQWGAHKYNSGLAGESLFTGADCYALRCSLLHQGVAQSSNGRWSRVFFTEPNDRHALAHLNVSGNMLNLDVGLFCVNMLNSVGQWLSTASTTDNYRRNFPRFLQRYPHGFGGLGGIPMIA